MWKNIYSFNPCADDPWYIPVQYNMILHYDDVIMRAMASQITSLTIVYSTVYSDADQRKHQSSASLAFVQGILRGPVNSPHKWPVTRKMYPFDDVIMVHNTSKTKGERWSYSKITKITPYLALTSELWGVFCGFFKETRQRNIESVLCLECMHITMRSQESHIYRLKSPATRLLVQ